jgi:hypothetical protein
MTNKRFLIAVVCASGLLVAGVAAAQQSDAPKDAPVQRVTTPAVDPDLARGFGIFRKQQVAADVPPAQADGFFGVNPKLARLAATLATGAKVYMAPANGGFCLIEEPSGARSCGELGTDARSAAQVSSAFCGAGLPDGKYTITLAVGDGVSNVVRVDQAGTRISLPIANNIASYVGDKRDPVPASIQWQAADGSHELKAPVPPDALGSCLPRPDGR